MYENTTRLRIELDVAALKVTQMLETHNKEVQEQVQIGVSAAIEELTKENALADMVKEQVLKEVISQIRTTVGNYEMMRELRAKIQQGVTDEVCKFSDKIINEINEKLK